MTKVQQTSLSCFETLYNFLILSLQVLQNPPKLCYTSSPTLSIWKLFSLEARLKGNFMSCCSAAYKYSLWRCAQLFLEEEPNLISWRVSERSAATRVKLCQIWQCCINHSCLFQTSKNYVEEAIGEYSQEFSYKNIYKWGQGLSDWWGPLTGVCAGVTGLGRNTALTSMAGTHDH